MLKPLTVVGFAVALATLPLQAEVIEQVLVRVNGDIVTKSDFEQRQVAALRTRPELANISPSSPDLKKAIEEVTPSLILDAVDELLLVQRGRELGYSMTDDQFKGILDNIKKENKLEDEAVFQAALKQEGLTLVELRRNLERQMLVSRVQQQEITGRVSITDDEAKAYYDANKKEFTTPVELMFREILISVPTTPQGVNVAADEAARSRIEGLRSRLLAGEPFPRLATEESDSGSKANGGLIGPINDDELAPSLRALVDALKVGEVSQPIRVARGYQLLKLESRTEPMVKSFDEARSDIGNRIGQRKLDSERSKYLQRMRETATIVWRNDELKRAYDLALSRSATEARPSN
ncbi:MAG: peptidyl-prolyl cis-trans isomerase [Vicinamibacterales bacterium]